MGRMDKILTTFRSWSHVKTFLALSSATLEVVADGLLPGAEAAENALCCLPVAAQEDWDYFSTAATERGLHFFFFSVCLL
jgi:hypothetical protein